MEIRLCPNAVVAAFGTAGPSTVSCQFQHLGPMAATPRGGPSISVEEKPVVAYAVVGSSISVEKKPVVAYAVVSSSILGAPS